MSSKPGGDIAQYVSSTDQVMTASNYNELDGFVFAELSYVKYESSKISWSTSELENGISAKLFAERILQQGKNCVSEEQRELLNSIANSERYSQCTITDLAACDGTEMWNAGEVSKLSDDAQWGAMTIQMNDGSGSEVIAMRGTNGTKLGWGEDLELGFERYGTTHQRLSRDYLAASDADRIYMTGHSKGGNACSSAYMMNESDVRDRVISIDNFDGPGHNDEFISV